MPNAQKPDSLLVKTGRHGRLLTGAALTAGAASIAQANASARCHARAKHSGLPCKGAAVRGWKVCRVHGAGAGAPRGKKHGHYKDGYHSIEQVEQREADRFMRRAAKIIEKALG